MNAEINLAHYIDKFESIRDTNHINQQESMSVVPDQENVIELLEEPDNKQRLLLILFADLKWTINSESKVSFISPFMENFIGSDAKYIIKKIASRYLTQSSIVACLIELEELNAILRTSKNTRPRKIILDTVINEYDIKKVEITHSAIFDKQGNVVGLRGLCQFLKNDISRV